jgi:pimeloyl-ACP methyl ester carboxylesterase
LIFFYLLPPILVAAVLVWAWAPDRERSALDAKYAHAATEYRSVAAATLRVRDTGPAGAPAVVLLHGFGSSLETWDPWAEVLSQEFRVVRFDFPGAGLSGRDPHEDYGDARSVELLRSLMSQLGLARAALVGNSLGGRIAWRFAAQFPANVSRLVLISPDGFASPGFDYGRPPKVPGILKLMKYFLPKRVLRANLAAAYGDPLRLGDLRVDRYYDLLLATGNREAMIARMRQTVLEDPAPTLRRIQTPTLLMWGERDKMIPISNAGDYLRCLPHAELVSFATLGHVPHEEAPAESIEPLLRFLRAAPLT